jgi:hypothetical protein
VQEYALGAATPVGHPAGEADLRDTEGANELGLLNGIDCVADQPVHVRRGESRIGERGNDRLGGELCLAATGRLRELRLPNADDRGRVTEPPIHRPPPWV